MPDGMASSMIRGYQASDVDQVMEIWDEASVIAHSFLDQEAGHMQVFMRRPQR